MVVNGKNYTFKNAITILELLDYLKLKKEVVVIELNKNIIDRENYETTRLEDTDTVEVISFVGGG